MVSNSSRIWLARLAIGLVFVWNILSALAFLLWPSRYAASYELSAAPGEAALRGVGLLFVMWNIPYAVALWQPVRQRISLYEATAMQAIAVFGETLIWLGLSPAHGVLRTSLMRFIIFDLAGLALLLLAVWLVNRTRLAR